MLSGLVIDWGGVLTAPMDAAFTGWAEHEQVAPEHFRSVIRGWVSHADGQAVPTPMPTAASVLDVPPESSSPMHRLERGQLSPAEFEQLLAAELAAQGSHVRAEGLLGRLLAGVQSLDPRMIAMLRTVRQAGIRTALLSNSWGEHYPDELFQGLFDVVVISGRVGIRKPEPAIYQRVLDDLGLPPGDCVMVDDIPRNVHAAVSLGMVGVVHTTVDQTLGELEVLLGVPLTG